MIRFLEYHIVLENLLRKYIEKGRYIKRKSAVITGASSELGKQMAKGFVNQGEDLVIMAR